MYFINSIFQFLDKFNLSQQVFNNLKQKSIFLNFYSETTEFMTVSTYK